MSAEQFELDELLGAYALNAVDDDERRRIEHHLAENPRARRELHEHREVAALLGWSAAAAPDGLWDRIASAIDEPAPRPSGQLAEVLAIDRPVGRPGRSARAAPRWTPWVIGVAAAAVVAIVAVAAVDSRSQPPIEAAVAAARSDRDSMMTDLVRADGRMGAQAIIDQDGHGYLMGDDLPELGEDQTYQLWGVMNDDVISLGVLGNSPEVEMFTAGMPVSALVLTVERAGGVVSNGNPDGAYTGSTA